MENNVIIGTAGTTVTGGTSAEIAAMKMQLGIALVYLGSIASNSCCEGCQEAKKVAQEALERMEARVHYSHKKTLGDNNVR